PVEAAYVAGVVDGEGTITLTRTHPGERRRPVISISSNELSMLSYVPSVVGYGKITTKAKRSSHHPPRHSYVVTSRRALSLLREIAPYLHTYKAERARLLLSSYLAATPRNGRYSAAQRCARDAMERRFFEISVRAKAQTALA